MGVLVVEEAPFVFIGMFAEDFSTHDFVLDVLHLFLSDGEVLVLCDSVGRYDLLESLEVHVDQYALLQLAGEFEIFVVGVEIDREYS